MHKYFVLFLVLSAATLAGCETTIKEDAPLPPSQNVTPGSTLTVVKSFLIPSGDTSVYFQDTRLYPQGDVQPNYPFCQFVTDAATPAGEVIKAQIFTVGKVEYDEHGTGPHDMDVSVTGIHLQAASSKNAYRMNCMLPLPSQGALFVTPAEVQGAIGGYMNLKEGP